VIERTPDLATGEVRTRSRTVSLDEGPRADTSIDGLAKLRTVFAAKGSVTAGNSSQTSDGAGALILASERAVRQYNLQPLARFVSFASRGVPPEIMGIGPIEAIPAALRSAGLSLSAIDWIELNEAFAAQSLAVIQGVGLDPAKVTEKTLARYLYHPEVPDVDLFLRPSGEQRTSNFLLWQSAYAEMVFLDTLWPDFDRRHLWYACELYAQRDRRFGGALPNPVAPTT